MIKQFLYTLLLLIPLALIQCDTPSTPQIPADAPTQSSQSSNTLPQHKTFHAAALANDTQSLRDLWDAGELTLNTLDDTGHTPLHIAIQSQHPESVQWLLSYKADPLGAQSPLDPPMSSAILIASATQRHSPEQHTAFHIITQLIDHGIDPSHSYNGRPSAIQLAMANDCEPCITHLKKIIDGKNTSENRL